VAGTLRFDSTSRSAVVTIAASEVGQVTRFDFWVFVERDRKLVDTAPTHLLVAPSSEPWTYPKEGTPRAGAAYPVETYTDSTDTSLVEGSFQWYLILLGIAALGALVGIGGWTYDKLHRRPPPTALAGP
jgi:hypothetical protein